ncbi:MAG TPA: DUF6292 family protein [Amycolatopsis sp.]|nr:DUF6292 family protein [Amycolatopsis sp.]
MDGRDGLGIPARGLRRYVMLVGAALDSPAWYCEVEVPASAYLAVEGRIPRYPDQEIALVWDERDGWAALLESAGGDEVVLAYLGEDVLPPPERVAEFAQELFADGYPGRPDAPDLRGPGDPDGFDDRIAGYAESDVCLP